MNRMMRNLYLKDLKPNALIAELEILEWRFERLAEHARSLELEARYTRSLAVKWWREYLRVTRHPE